MTDNLPALQDFDAQLKMLHVLVGHKEFAVKDRIIVRPSLFQVYGNAIPLIFPSVGTVVSCEPYGEMFHIDPFYAEGDPMSDPQYRASRTQQSLEQIDLVIKHYEGKWICLDRDEILQALGVLRHLVENADNIRFKIQSLLSPSEVMDFREKFFECYGNPTHIVQIGYDMRNDIPFYRTAKNVFRLTKVITRAVRNVEQRRFGNRPSAVATAPSESSPRI